MGLVRRVGFPIIVGLSLGQRPRSVQVAKMIYAGLAGAIWTLTDDSVQVAKMDLCRPEAGAIW